MNCHNLQLHCTALLWWKEIWWKRWWRHWFGGRGWQVVSFMHQRLVAAPDEWSTSSLFSPGANISTKWCSSFPLSNRHQMNRQLPDFSLSLPGANVNCRWLHAGTISANVTINTCQHVVSHHLHHLQFGTCTKMVHFSSQKTPPSVVPKVLLDWSSTILDIFPNDWRCGASCAINGIRGGREG